MKKRQTDQIISTLKKQIAFAGNLKKAAKKRKNHEQEKLYTEMKEAYEKMLEQLISSG